MASFLREHRLGDRRVNGDDGYALVTVIGLGTAILLSVGAVSAYSLQAMDSAGSTQGFHASVQAAQAGVDRFVAQLNSGSSPALNVDWQVVPGSHDGTGDDCGGTLPGGSPPPNCPEFSYDADPIDGGYEITSSGRSRGDVRAVRVTLRQRTLTDYLYYSAIEAADPLDGFVYPTVLGLGGAPPGCGYPSWNTEDPMQVRPPSGCRIPQWRGGDTTEGSRVHTADVFAATGEPIFDSRVSVANPSCATNPATCVSGGPPTYKQGNPTYANDLTMPPSPLDQIVAAALGATGCTYTGPTRIEFLKAPNSGKMKVWSPQSTFATTAERDRCLGGEPPSLPLTLDVNVRVGATGNIDLLGGLVGGLLGTTCTLLGIGCPSKVAVSVDAILTSGLLKDLTGGLATLLPYTPNPVAVPSAIHVKDATQGTTTALQNVQCLLASVAGVGLHSGDLQLGLNGLLGSAGSGRCRAGDLYVSGELSGRTTIGTTGGVTVMDDLTYKNRATDLLGIVALGPVEVYNSVQCVLGLGTCLSLSSLSGLLPGLTTLLAQPNPTKADLTGVLNSLGANQSVTVDAAILTYRRFGVQLPVLSPNLNLNLVNRLVDLNITPPALNVYGSVAQQYRGLTSADLVSITTNASGSAGSIDLLSANVDIGFALKMQYDEKLRTDRPLHLPAPPATARYDQISFAEVPAVD